MGRRCAAVTLILALALGTCSVPSDAAGTRSQSARFAVRVSMLPVARVRVVEQHESVTVTAADAAVGYVDVRAGTHVELQGGGGCLVSFSPLLPWTSSATIRGLAGEVALDAAGGSFAAPAPSGGHVALALDYRFRLSDGIGPGTYPWPVGITITLP